MYERVKKGIQSRNRRRTIDQSQLLSMHPISILCPLIHLSFYHIYRFSIVNLTKPDSLYKEGMRPLMYSTTDATNNNIGWRRCGENIAYFRNEDNNIYSTRNYHQVLIDDFDDEDNGNICSFTLTFNIEFQHDNDTVYFAHSYPYTYSDLQDYLMNIQRHPIKSKFCKLRLLCRSLAGNNVYYLTVTAPSTPEEEMQKVCC